MTKIWILFLIFGVLISRIFISITFDIVRFLFLTELRVKLAQLQ